MGIKVSEEVADVLRRSTIGDNSVALPNEQLARPLYEAVNKVLDAYGGKWNRKLRAHVFTSDPRVKLAGALESGVAVHEQQTFQSFYTPMEIVEKMVRLAGLLPGMTVLEPSAGDGRIAKAARDAGCEVYFAEIREELRPALEAMGCRFVGYDFMQPPFKIVRGGYDRILMNPPFTKGQDADHITKAFGLLKSGGILVAVASPAVEFRTDKRYTAFRTLVEIHGDIEGVPAGAFSKEGTEIRTVLVRLVKPLDPKESPRGE
jgi:predicted RNA methylase